MNGAAQVSPRRPSHGEEAGHRAVLLAEALEALALTPSGIYVDATFGRGGHSRAILERLGPDGRLLALDRDPQAIAEARRIDDRRFLARHRPFAELAAAVRESGFTTVDGVLFDLGVSSPQLDEGARGFSFRFDAPLDMRMDPAQEETAASFLATADVRKLTEVIKRYGEERFAFQVAKKIVAARSERPVATTRQLASLVREAVRTRELGQDPATRTFQALRIHVNQELEQLALALPQAVDVLKTGGRLVAISFHSLEDRIVKTFLREQSSDGLPKNLPLRAAELPLPPLRRIGKPVRAGDEEVAANPRARSAVMRVAERLAGGAERKTSASPSLPRSSPPKAEKVKKAGASRFSFAHIPIARRVTRRKSTRPRASTRCFAPCPSAPERKAV